MNILQLSGKEENHLIPFEKFIIHNDLKEDLNILFNLLQNLNCKPLIISSYRSYGHQKKIWEKKCLGETKTMDFQGNNEIDIKDLSPKEHLFFMLRWSAIPGLSRHHWGTELDLVENIPNYTCQLIPLEFCQNGAYFNFSKKLQNLLQEKNLPFHFPYNKEVNGVGLEPWHLSYTKTSKKIENLLTIDTCKKIVSDSQFTYKDIILENLEEIYNRFIKNHFL